MKLSILGGGGFRVPLVFEAVATGATGLTVDTISLYDVDEDRLRTIARVVDQLGAELLAEGRAAHGLPRVEVTTDLAHALRAADFVFSAVRVGGAEGRTVDERVALGLGLLGQETIGPGGLAYALRTIPVALEIARTVREVAPGAWVINFTNPAGIVTEAMRSVLGDHVVGICDTPIGLVRRVGRLLDLDVNDLEAPADRRVRIDYVGLNHLGWLRGIEVGGKDRLPEILASDAELDRIEEARLIGFDWVRTMGALPNEYLFYYLFTEDARSRIAAADLTRGEFLARQQGGFYESAGDACCTSPLSEWRRTLHEREATYMAETRDEERREEDVAGGGYQEVALRLMTAIATGTPERMILDVGNGPADPARGAGPEASAEGASARRIVPELPADLVLEVPCIVDGDGVHPEPVGPLTLYQLGMMARLRASERCILEAVQIALRAEGDPDPAGAGDRARQLREQATRKAWEGFATHPLVDSPELGRRLLEGYVQGHPQIARLLAGGSIEQ